jgi:Rrf2 family protein
MRLTRAAAYAVHALAHLAAEGDGHHATERDIIRDGRMPRSFVGKVLGALVRGRLLSARRGPNGGYRLGRPAARITLLEVVEAVDGPLDNHCAAPPSAHPAFDRRLEAAYGRAAGALRRELARVRLSDLAGVG